MSEANMMTRAEADDAMRKLAEAFAGMPGADFRYAFVDGCIQIRFWQDDDDVHADRADAMLLAAGLPENPDRSEENRTFGMVRRILYYCYETPEPEPAEEPVPAEEPAPAEEPVPPAQ